MSLSPEREKEIKAGYDDSPEVQDLFSEIYRLREENAMLDKCYRGAEEDLHRVHDDLDKFHIAVEALECYASPKCWDEMERFEGSESIAQEALAKIRGEKK